MRIKPSSWTPPYSYEGLPVLPRPAQGRSFAALASRVALFGRDGVVDIGSRMLWHIWDHSEELDHNEFGTALVRGGALPLIALGLMFGATGTRPCPTEVEFRLLCWEFHNLPEFSGQDTAAARQERDEAKAKLRELPSASRLSGLPQQAPAEIRGLWVRGKQGCGAAVAVRRRARIRLGARRVDLRATAASDGRRRKFELSQVGAGVLSHGLPAICPRRADAPWCCDPSRWGGRTYPRTSRHRCW